MIVELTYKGKAVRFNGDAWEGDAALASYCKVLERGLPFAYYPSPVFDIAEAVSKELAGATVRVITAVPVPTVPIPDGLDY